MSIWSDVLAEFVPYARSVEMVTIDDPGRVEETMAQVSGRLVRLKFRLTAEQRLDVDVAGIRQRLLEAGASEVVDRTTTIRGRTRQARPRRDGYEALASWVRRSGEEDAVVQRALEFLDEVTGR